MEKVIILRHPPTNLQAIVLQLTRTYSLEYLDIKGSCHLNFTKVLGLIQSYTPGSKQKGFSL